jgi:hypothetical protein
MNQSIEDASRREFESAMKLNGYAKADLRFLEHGQIYMSSRIHDMWWAWQAARQSSQSEPVYVEFQEADGLPWQPVYNKRERADFEARGYKIRELYAAPQQAIPSGWIPTDAEVLEWNSRNDDKFQGKVHEARTAIEDARSMHLLSASPTAPIESDK